MKYYIYNGIPVKGPKAADAARFEEDNEHLDGCEVTLKEFNAAIKEAKRAATVEKRRQAYRNGDYIDAIMKQLNYDRLQGKDMIQDVDDAIAHWLSVKADNPLEN